MSSEVHISKLRPQSKNANRGTERGNQVLENSLRKYGAGRSILLDKHGNIIAGNQTFQKAGEIGIEKVIVVKTRGHELVAVQRTDLDLDKDKAAQELALADNRTGELNLSWQPDVLAAFSAADLATIGFSEKELERLLKQPLGFDGGAIADSPSDPAAEVGTASHVRMVQLFYNDKTVEDFNRAIETLMSRFGTDNVTDTVLEAVKLAADLPQARTARRRSK